MKSAKAVVLCGKASYRFRACVVIFLTHLLCLTTQSYAQVGDYRTDLAVGVNGGVSMSNVAFVPTVPQTWLNGPTFGLSARYTCEKYFNSICALVAEMNYTQLGWKEDILDKEDHPVPLHTDPSQTLNYSRKTNYLQVPLLARLGWGRERNGLQFFIQLGPQVGFYLNDQVETNFDARDIVSYYGKRSSTVVAQDSMAIENSMDYGIAAGAGLEFSNRHVGHFIVEGRYYYGLGNIYGNTKRDYFGRSNFGNIVVKLTYLFDIIRTKNSKIK